MDTRALESWIGDRLPGVGEPLAVERLAGPSASNFMYRLERAGRRWCLRRPPEYKISPTAHNVRREFRVLSALEGTDVPHAQPLLLCEDESIFGDVFMVTSWLDGVPPGPDLPPAILESPAELRRLAFSVIDGMAALARIDWRERGLEGFGKPDGFLERQVPRWLAQLERHKSRELPHLDQVTGWLEAHRPRRYPIGVMHGDLHLSNTLVSREPPAHLVGIVDWEQCTIGDPLLDLGWFVSLWNEPGEPATLLPGGDPEFSQRPGMPTRAELVERYASQSGLSVDHIAYYQVLTLFKIACVIEGSYYRYARGESQDPAHKSFEYVIPSMLERAVAIAEGRRV